MDLPLGANCRPVKSQWRYNALRLPLRNELARVLQKRAEHACHQSGIRFEQKEERVE